MANKLKVLSGKEIARILSGFGFTIHNQNGSHIKLRRTSSDTQQTLIIPNHSPITKGTIKAIFNQASKCVTEAELQKHFYTD